MQKQRSVHFFNDHFTIILQLLYMYYGIKKIGIYTGVIEKKLDFQHLKKP